MNWHWPILRTPMEAAHFWGWALILLAASKLFILGGMFWADAVRCVRKGDRRGAVFGFGVVLVAITTAAHAAVRGVFTVSMSYTPTGPKPLDIGTILLEFLPLWVFALQGLQRIRGGPMRLVNGNPPWTLWVVGALGVYTGGFIMRFVDAVSFHHLHLRWMNFDSGLSLVLWLLYLAMAIVWLRVQIRLRHSTGSWNVLGMSIALTFLAVSFHRLAQSVELSARAYRIHHSYAPYFWGTDLAAIGAALFFLVYAVSLLHRTAKRPAPPRVHHLHR